MKVFLWLIVHDKKAWWDHIVLWDGENTYWNEEMKPSSGYKKRPSLRRCNVTKSKFIYLGDL